MILLLEKSKTKDMNRTLITALMAVLLFTGCNSKTERINDLQRMGLNGKISEIVIVTHSAWVSNGMTKVASTKSDRHFNNLVLEFDENGNIVSRTKRRHSRILEYTTYEYDENGLLTAKISNNNYNNVNFKDIYEYDGDNIKSIISFDDNGDEIGKTCYEYNGDGIIIKKEIFKNGNLVSLDTLLSKETNCEIWEVSDKNGTDCAEYMYENGLLKERICGDQSSSFERDEHGNIIKSYNGMVSPEGEELFSSKAEDGVHIYEYKYDDNGNWKSRREYYGENKKLKFLISRKISYED